MMNKFLIQLSLVKMHFIRKWFQIKCLKTTTLVHELDFKMYDNIVERKQHEAYYFIFISFLQLLFDKI